jgi:hypothetical protein
MNAETSTLCRPGRRQTFLTASACVLCVLLLALVAAPRPAFAATEHLFDPCLSLTGNTQTGPLDECPDPGTSHPEQALFQPDGVTTDRFGDIYVSNYGGIEGEGNIKVFDPTGDFLTEFNDPHGPTSLAVDSQCNVYTVDFGRNYNIGSEASLSKYPLSNCPPSPSTTALAPVSVFASGDIEEFLTETYAVAVDPRNDRVFTTGRSEGKEQVLEFGPGGSGPPSTISLAATQGDGGNIKGIDIWGKTGEIFVAGRKNEDVVDGPGTIFVLSPSGALIDEISGEETPAGSFGSAFPYIAVDQSNGDVYVEDVHNGHEAVDQFQRSGGQYHYVGQLAHSFKVPARSVTDVAVDAPMEMGESAYSSPNSGEVFVTSGTELGLGHLYAFRPRTIGPPQVSARVFDIGADDAALEAKVNPNGLPTTFRFEYGSADCELGGCTSVPSEGKSAGEGGGVVSFAETLDGLQPSTTYHFRVVAENAESAPGSPTVTPDQTFKTFPTPSGLPDDRAYELVTPGNTNGLKPTSSPANSAIASVVETPYAAENGDSVLFLTLSGGFPPSEGNGAAEAYEAVRDETSGWHSRSISPSGQQAVFPLFGGASSDHRRTLWEIPHVGGSLDIGPSFTTYARNELGDFELIGHGEIADDPEAETKWMSPDGTKVIFANDRNADPEVPLTANAPPEHTIAIYSQGTGESARVVSLLPGNITPAAQQSAIWGGTNRSGNVIVFSLIDPTTGAQSLYERLDEDRTVEVSPSAASFAGVSSDGTKTFYEVYSGPEAGLWEFNAESQSRTQITPDGASLFVNVARDGARAYFSSPLLLDEGKGVPGGHNLYEWNGSVPHFIATLSADDFTGEQNLGKWTNHRDPGSSVVRGNPNEDPSRTTNDGEYFLFQSHSDLTPPYEALGHSEIYRYDAVTSQLVCVSCNPTGVSASTDAELVRAVRLEEFVGPTTVSSRIANMTEDGSTVVFQTREPLSVEDHDAFADVYEWHEGNLSLISSGKSEFDEDLYSMTPDASDIFFLSSEILLPEDAETTPSIYDARVNGGFAQPSTEPPCEGEGCRPEPVAPPAATSPGSELLHGNGNRVPHAAIRKCRKRVHRQKDAHRVEQRGKPRCVTRHSSHNHFHGRAPQGKSAKKGQK